MQIAQANMAVMAGDSFRPGLEQIFLEHKDLVYRAAYRVTGNSSDAEDVLQTVFLRLVRLGEISGNLQPSGLSAPFRGERVSGLAAREKRNFFPG